MKIKTVHKSYEEVMALPRPQHQRPNKPWFLLQTLIRVLSEGELRATDFSYTVEPGALPDEPCLILMNHSGFIDLKIASKILYPRRYGIVCTTDGMVGKGWLMRHIGCIPTQKFVTDLTLIRDMKHALDRKKISVLMYPEAGYSFDGCSTSIPKGLGGLLKILNVPVVMITTEGAFFREPLYNELRKRRVKVHARVRCLADREKIAGSSVAELDALLQEAFSFDSFAWQAEHRVKISEPDRANGLERILYKCPCCGEEGRMKGKGTRISCGKCNGTYEMDEYGELHACGDEPRLSSVPQWYRWERECVLDEINRGDYRMELDVRIGMIVDQKALYMVGEGHLTHTKDGFVLTGCEGKLRYEQKPNASHGLNADYYWYEIGDVIGIGNREALYYCFPKQEGVVTKARLAAEELYKMTSAGRRHWRVTEE